MKGMRTAVFLIVAQIIPLTGFRAFAADKIGVAYVSPSVTQAVAWIAKETGILSKYDLSAEIVLISGSPRLVQSLIAGDVDIAFAGVTALIRARLRGADATIVGTAANVSSQTLMVGRASKIS